MLEESSCLETEGEAEGETEEIVLGSCSWEAVVVSGRTEEIVLDLSPDLSVETDSEVDEEGTVVEVMEEVESVEETGADEDWASEDETEELTEPHVPARGLQPVPQ